MYDKNVYYSPESYGLEVVGDIEWTGESYQFDMTVVWKDKDGKYYVASDSGCSCPSPFEDYNSLESLDGPLRAVDVVNSLNYRVNQFSDGESSYGYSRAEVAKQVSTLTSRL
jgi:hypothetical protein